MAPTIDRKFAENLLRCFDDPQEYGVHLLFNDWWQHAPQEAIDKYQADFRAVPEMQDFVASEHFAPQVDLAQLKACPDGSLGRGYHDFLVNNGLEQNLATNYKMLHDLMKQGGQLDRMPAELQYAIIRGFQQHDIMHVITGYEATGDGEIALQAFCLAQLRFPYFSMWMSVVTARMTYLDPDMIIPIMDNISQGWQYGRTVKNIQLEKWEDKFDQPLAAIRRECGIDPAGMVPLAA
ncbi:MAG: Coq4 family protein [Alphaproteobacteria bacterium]